MIKEELKKIDPSIHLANFLVPLVTWQPISVFLRSTHFSSILYNDLYKGYFSQLMAGYVIKPIQFILTFGCHRLDMAQKTTFTPVS
jgi:hypothetical protein